MSYGYISMSLYMQTLKWRTESDYRRTDKGLEAGGMALDEQGLPAGVLCACAPSTEKFCKEDDAHAV